MNRDDAPNRKEGKESASDKLRRILASKEGSKQEIDDVSSSSVNEKLSKAAQTMKKENRNKRPSAVEEPYEGEEIDGLPDSPPGRKASLQNMGFSNNIKSTLKRIFFQIKEIFRRGDGDEPPKRLLRGNLYNFFKKNPKGCLIYGFLGILFVAIITGIAVLSLLIFQYFRIASDLPSVENLREYASQFETTRIYDRNGNLIYEIIDPNAGRRTFVSIDEISPYLIAATIATEDKDFYTNPGFDPLGIIRALWQNYTSGKVVSGASTITQQLARTLLLSPEERVQITTRRKAREIVLASEITRKYSKNEILELYLNENNYGNLAYGIEAAAETYFNTTADQLNLAQASFLAGLPQAPAVYDIFTNPEASLSRHLDVLNLMYQLSKERNCISIAQSKDPICVTLNEAVASAQEIENYQFKKRLFSMPYPHWVNFIRLQLEDQFDPQTIYRSGFKVYTTLDPELQNYVQDAVKEQVDELRENNATSGAVVAIKPDSGEILALVGSADFFNEEISGQVNMAISPRQPGSSIKPFTYLAAFEKGWTPATLIWDVPSEFPPSGDPNDTRPPYKPVNYDGKFHGPVLMRTALGSSYNIPAVKTLDFVGIYDDPTTSQKDGLIAFMERLGFTTLTRDDYGLSLTLGGGDVSLLEMTTAYAVIANAGKDVNPYAIEKIFDHTGNLVYEHVGETETQIIRADHAYLMSSILSDNNARAPAFGANSILKLPFSAAVKTGTTNDFRDNWTIGYTPDIAVGVWIGNADYTPMKNISGVSGAGPLWNAVMQWAVNTYLGGSPSQFKRPNSIKEHVICRVSGTKPSDHCSLQKTEIFTSDQPPLEKEEDLWQDIALDTWTNLKAGPACSEFTEEKLTINVHEKWAVKWLKENENGKAWLKENGFNTPVIFTPERECTGDDPRPTIVFVGLNDDMNITSSPLDIYAVINATGNFQKYYLQYGIGNNPSKWKTLAKGKKTFSQPKKLITWDVYEAGASRITLRILVKSTIKTEAEKRIQLNLLVPTLTPTITPTLTPTETPTATIEQTLTPELTLTETIGLPPDSTETPIPTAEP
ncbi:MAG: transglycosylase domain-containing protein [Anaerolineaceae bacterium]|nr:transglycosylase domain-containing protein [Anaerolineaceae bacterium]